MSDFIVNIREDGTKELINPYYDELVAAAKERDEKIQEEASQIIFTEEELKLHEIQYNNYLALEYLKKTDWIAAKYTDEVVILKNMTDEEFSLKYKDILDERKRSRETITEIE